MESFFRRSIVGQPLSALFQFNRVAIGSPETPQPAIIDVGVRLTSDRHGAAVRVPFCSSEVSRVTGWDYAAHYAFEERGFARFRRSKLPFDRRIRFGVIRMLATVHQADDNHAVIEPLATTILPLIALEGFAPSDFEYSSGRLAAATSYCLEHQQELQARLGTDFLYDASWGPTFNGNWDALFFNEGVVLSAPKKDVVRVWGERLDLAQTGIERWLNTSRALHVLDAAI